MKLVKTNPKTIITVQPNVLPTISSKSTLIVKVYSRPSTGEQHLKAEFGCSYENNKKNLAIYIAKCLKTLNIREYDSLIVDNSLKKNQIPDDTSIRRYLNSEKPFKLVYEEENSIDLEVLKSAEKETRKSKRKTIKAKTKKTS